MSELVLAGGVGPRQLARVLTRLLLASVGALLWLLAAETAAQAQEAQEAPRGPEGAAAHSQAAEAKPPVAQSPQPQHPEQTPPAQTPPPVTAPVGPPSSESPGQGVGRPESPEAPGSVPGRGADVPAEVVAEPVVDAVEAIASVPGQTQRAVQRPGREPKQTAEPSTPAPVATTPAATPVKAAAPAARAPRRPAADPEPRLASLPLAATPSGSGLAPVGDAGPHERRTASLVPVPAAAQDAERHVAPVPTPFEPDERLADLMAGGDASGGNGAPSPSGGSVIAFATLGSSQLLPACAVLTWDSAVRQHALPTGPSYAPGSSPG
ncbi:hypothetical protein [Nocardioides pacificus]